MSTEVKKTDKSMPTKIPQPHGGALNSGGTPGNKGGPGNIPRRIRLKAGEMLEGKALPRMDETLENGTRMEAVAATNTLVKIALPTQKEHTFVSDTAVYEAWAGVVAERFGPEVLAELLPEVKSRLGESAE